MPVKKIVYLLGAGATHSEVMNLTEDPDATFRDKYGILISDVSKRVMKEAQRVPGFKSDVEFVTAAEGSLNIELLISLIESNQLPQSGRKANSLKDLVRKDITKQLSQTKRNRFYLHKALFELHSLIENREALQGVISLNYDSVLDDAYSANGITANYFFPPEKTEGIPLLKLHGSFDWTSINMYGKRKRLSIIPLGIYKKYLNPPYNFIWGKAFDLLARCDILRIIGCSFSQNDIGLVDLLFKSHLERTSILEMQIINFQSQGDGIKNNYGFFPGIVKPFQIEDSLIADLSILSPEEGGNPFKVWLKAKAMRMVENDVPHSTFLRKCFQVGVQIHAKKKRSIKKKTA